MVCKTATNIVLSGSESEDNFNTLGARELSILAIIMGFILSMVSVVLLGLVVGATDGIFRIFMVALILCILLVSIWMFLYGIIRCCGYSKNKENTVVDSSEDCEVN